MPLNSSPARGTSDNCWVIIIWVKIITISWEQRNKTSCFWGERGRENKEKRGSIGVVCGEIAYMCFVMWLVMTSWLSHWTHGFTFEDTKSLTEGFPS